FNFRRTPLSLRFAAGPPRQGAERGNRPLDAPPHSHGRTRLRHAHGLGRLHGTTLEPPTRLAPRPHHHSRRAGGLTTFSTVRHTKIHACQSIPLPACGFASLL